MINWDKVQELAEDVGQDAFGEVLELFLSEVETALRCLPVSDDIEAAVHFVKGCALNLGFEQLALACATAERLAATGAPDKVDITALDRIYQSSRDLFLAEYRQRLAA
ncbi:Hpt domain-containing protein [Pseudooceanicola sp. C21-150M6]|uniref:Hpt domain-containing protein n=1 Tax=Pseudooceanicola sp. C21-150M6 TaxID=3434355 RepID=UPI003D7FEFAC